MPDPTVTPDPMDEAATRCAERAADDRDLMAAVEDDLLRATAGANDRLHATRFTLADVERVRDEAVTAERKRIAAQLLELSISLDYAAEGHVAEFARSLAPFNIDAETDQR